MIDFKKLSLALIISFNANADFFGDVGDFCEENATEVALVGIGALTVATIAIKPIRGIIKMEREAVALEAANKTWSSSTLSLDAKDSRLFPRASAPARISVDGVEAESLEVAASKLNVEEGATGGEIFNSFKGYKYEGDNKWVEEDLALEGATGKATTSKELSSFQ
jgi:hypothetical protein